MLRRIVINSASSGKYREQLINNRPHLVTSMVSISLDSVMNRVFYPAAAVREAHMQLDRVPAPASHPVLDGLFISAKDPVAVNAHNIGAFALNPRIEGRHVVNDLAIDVQVAERDERGVETMRRITAGERIGVSTGLNGSLVLVKGNFDGQQYDGILSNMEFDHVAILLDEAPAGDATFTLNASKADDIVICNLDQSVNDLRDQLCALARQQFGTADNCYVYVQDIELDPDFAIVDVDDQLLRVPFTVDSAGKASFTGAGVRVRRVVTFEANASPPPRPEGRDMNKDLLILAIIGNNANSFGIDDKAKLEGMSEVELMNALHGAVKRPDITADKAREVCEAAGLAVNAAAEVEGLQEWQANREAFQAFRATQDAARKEKCELVVNHSELTAEDVANLDDAALDRLAHSIIPNQDYSGQGGAPVRRAASGGNVVCADF